MKVLLDTCTFLWMNQNPRLLSETATTQVLNLGNELYLSAASAWEIRRDLNGVQALPVVEADGFLLTKLPKLHGDPFDRMMVCQAINGDMTILTPDPRIHRYPVKTAW